MTRKSAYTANIQSPERRNAHAMQLQHPHVNGLHVQPLTRKSAPQAHELSAPTAHDQITALTCLQHELHHQALSHHEPAVHACSTNSQVTSSHPEHPDRAHPVCSQQDQPHEERRDHRATYQADLR